MIILGLGITLFILPHLLREFGVRDILIAKLGVGRYKGLFSLAVASSLGLIVWGMSVAPFVQLWSPFYELRYISLMAMIPACVLLAASNLPMSYIRHEVRHPMLLGVLMWAAAHLWANGDLASLMLFGGFALWALVKIVSLNLHTSTENRPPAIIWDAVALIGGLCLYVVLLLSHGLLFAVQISLE